jgi:hypothetical protein
MSYVSNNPTSRGPTPQQPSSAQSRLARRGWRLRHSAWLLAPILGMGLVSWVGFVYIAARTRRVAWWITALVYTAVGVIAMVLVFSSTGQEDPRLDIGMTLLLLGWLGGTLHAIFLNRDYLRWRASLADTPWYAPQAPQSLEFPSQSARPAPTRSASETYGASPQRMLGLDEANYYVPSPQPPVGQRPAARQQLAEQQTAVPGPDQSPQGQIPADQRPQSNARSVPLPVPSVPPMPDIGTQKHPTHVQVDMNTATVQALAALPGLDVAWAHHIISVREARGGRFRDVDDFVAATALQPHQLIKLKPHVVVNDTANHVQQPRPGRILDV